ncbi:MAG TPA: hypothetical protein VMH05_04955 [Bryobacteraceae bacterium]|nr:hypothetical protein [Bryobacteraceae bacterium]
MPSKSQTARINGAKSRGPKTESGRARSSQNALKHGLCSQTLVLPSEDPADFDALLAAYLQQLRPIGPVELDLVHEMVAAKWRLDRIAGIETQLFVEAIDRVEEYSDDPLTPDQALASAFERLANGPSLNVLHRMESRFARTYSRALRNLLQLQRDRNKPPAAPPAPTGDENEICKNEPTDPPLDGPTPSTGYINAPDPPLLAPPAGIPINAQPQANPPIRQSP